RRSPRSPGLGSPRPTGATCYVAPAHPARPGPNGPTTAPAPHRPPIAAGGHDGRMKAVVHHRYGPPEVLRVTDVPARAPADDEVLVRVHATTVTRTDAGLRSAEIPISRLVTGLRRPKNTIGGMELAGVVTATGASVTEFAVGDEVFG